MPASPDPTTEGRLIALRQALALIAAGKPPDAIAAALDAPVQDGQEDPGAVPNPAFGIEAAIAEERRRIAAEIRLRSGAG
jgi:hypothetical protein